MTLQEFMKAYRSETACQEALLAYRLKNGVVCKKCQSTAHYWLKTVKQFKCKHCQFRTTLRSGTIMQASKLPYHYWFTALFLMTMTKKSFSSCDVQRILGHKRNEPIWYMMHKIRMVMGRENEKLILSGTIELDEAFFVTVDPDRASGKIKRGRGSQRQTKVLVLAESEEVYQKGKHKKSRRCRSFRLQVINDLDAESINREVIRQVQTSSHILTDKYRGYVKLKEIVTKHQAVECPPDQASEILPWVHTCIANAKRVFLAAYHRINTDYLQNYLSEFCYRLNRRFANTSIFDQLLNATVKGSWYI